MPPIVPIINGSITPQINEVFFSFKPFSGGEQGGVYEGLDQYVHPLIQPLLDAGYGVDYKKSKDYVSTLRFSGAFSVASAGGGAVNPNVDYKDTWELIRNTVHKELLESDHPLVAALDSTNLVELKNLINGSVKFTSNGENFSATTADPAPGVDLSYDAAVYLWALYQSGVRTVEVKQPILRLTRTTNQLYNAAWSVTSVDKLLTTASMIADSGVPNSFAIPMNALATQLMRKAFTNPPYTGGIPDPPIILRPYTAAAAPWPQDTLILEFAWLKDLIGETKHGSQRVVYTVEWKFGLYDVRLFGLAQ